MLLPVVTSIFDTLRRVIYIVSAIVKQLNKISHVRVLSFVKKTEPYATKPAI